LLKRLLMNRQKPFFAAVTTPDFFQGGQAE
jgi:hypothetical protein